ncbi:hypothetical protein GCM10028792_22780 [Salinisphaera aquimarina]
MGGWEAAGYRVDEAKLYPRQPSIVHRFACQCTARAYTSTRASTGRVGKRSGVGVRPAFFERPEIGGSFVDAFYESPDSRASVFQAAAA